MYGVKYSIIIMCMLFTAQRLRVAKRARILIDVRTLYMVGVNKERGKEREEDGSEG